MKKSTLILALSIVSVSAMAQTGMTGFSLRGGYSYLADKNTRKATSNSGYTAGASYDLNGIKGLALGPGAKLSVDVDYDYHSGHGNKLYTYSGQLVGRFPLTEGKAGKGMSFYGGLGAGYFSSHESTGAVGSVVASHKTKSGFGGEFLLGANVSKQAFVEVVYRASQTVSGYKPSVLNVVVGVKF